MKIAIGVMIAMICINAGAIWIETVYGPSPILTPVNETDYYQQVNASALAEGYTQNPSDNIVDFTAVLTWIWDLNLPFIEAFWNMVRNAGLPITLVRVLKIPYRLLELFLLAEIVRNMDLSG